VPMAVYIINLNVELIPICHLLALLGARHILHVSGIRVSLSGFTFLPETTEFRYPLRT